SFLLTILPMLHLLPELSPGWSSSILEFVLVVAMFSTARQDNGWAGFHDLISQTRVTVRILKTARRTKSVLEAPGASCSFPDGAGKRFGPYITGTNAVEPSHGGVVIAFDPILRRRIWIHPVPAATPPIRSERRDVGRTGRLFWLMGRRSDSYNGENWDAFE